MDLDYDPKSFVGPLDQEEIGQFERWLRDSGYDRVRFDRAYVAHLSRFHGGVPGKRYFQTTTGTKHVIERFLNFLGAGSDNPLEQYGVEPTWSLLSDRMGQYLIPFAELFGGDKLCFDYEKAGRPRVVVWYHEQSHPGHAPHTEFVAANFDEFLSALKEKPQ